MKKKYQNYIDNKLGDMTGKKVVVTGANSGIGFAICDILLYKNASIVMACRNEAKANYAKEELLKRHANAEISFIKYDQSNLESIDNFVSELTSRHQDFYALVLNAGIFKPNKKSTYYNVVLSTYGVNYISLIYLMYRLTPFLECSEVYRKIIFEGSLASFISRYKSKHLYNFKLRRMKQYNLSKLGVTNAFMFFALSNKNPNIKFALSEPGIAATNIYRNYNKVFKAIANFFVRLIFNSVICGALPTCEVVCNTIGNLAYCKPRGFLRIKGWPKYYDYPMYSFNESIIADAYHVLGDINGRK